MSSHDSKTSQQGFVAWMTIVGGVMALVCLGLYMVVSQFDTHAMFRPEYALNLSEQGRMLFIFSQVADCFGFYLPVLAVAIYMWRLLRSDASVVLDIAIAFLVISTVLGVSGSALQLATIKPLAMAHAAGDSAASAVWLAVAYGAQHGLWLLEGPTLGFWAIVTGAALRRRQVGLGTPLMMIGVCYLAYFVLMVLGNERIGSLGLLVVLPLQALWILAAGVMLLKSSSSLARLA